MGQEIRARLGNRRVHASARLRVYPDRSISRSGSDHKGAQALATGDRPARPMAWHAGVGRDLPSRRAVGVLQLHLPAARPDRVGSPRVRWPPQTPGPGADSTRPGVLGALPEGGPHHGLARGQRTARRGRGRTRGGDGLIPAIVTKVKDTGHDRHNIGMVQVYFPGLQQRDDPHLINPWARLVRTDAGDNCGHIVVPQIDDEVVCGFEHGDIHHPYVIGSVWNGNAKAPDPSGTGSAGGPASAHGRAGPARRGARRTRSRSSAAGRATRSSSTTKTRSSSWNPPLVRAASRSATTPTRSTSSRPVATSRPTRPRTSMLRPATT